MSSVTLRIIIMKSTDTRLLTLIAILLTLSVYAQNTPFHPATIPPFTTDNFQSFVIDFDNDGDDDLVGWQHHVNNSARLYRNNGNTTFTDVSSLLNFPPLNSGIAADLDKNGFMDVYYISGDTLIYTLNNGLVFSSPNSSCSYHLLSAIFSTAPANIQTVKLGDYNSDGWYDIAAHITNGSASYIRAKSGKQLCDSCVIGWNSSPVQTLVNFGNTTVTKIQFADIDNDGDFDLLIGRDGGFYNYCSYSIYLNNGTGVYSFSPGSGYTLGRESAFATLGDFNNDSRTDIACGARDCCLGANPLYMYYSAGTGTFAQSTAALPRSLNPYYEGATVVDINLDRRLDIIWTNMVSISNGQLQCHLNNGNNTFTESAASLNLSYGPVNGACCPIQNTEAATLIDFNNDNKPDIDIHEIDAVSPYTVVNKWQRINSSSNKAIKLRLVACTGLREGWGARIAYKSGGTWSYQQHSAYSASNYPFLYLGMGSNSVVDSLVVNWMGGAISTLTNLAANQYYTIEENPNCSFNTPGFSLNLIVQDSIMACADSISINALPGMTSYLWSNGDQTSSVSISSSGKYLVTATNGQGCEAKDSAYVTLLRPTLIQIDSAICNGQSTALSVSIGSSYSWSTGDTSASITVSPSQNSSYYVTASDGNSCAHMTFDVTVNPKMVAGYIAAPNDTVCQGDSIRLRVAGGNGNIQWQVSLTPDSFVTVSGATDSAYTVPVAQTAYFRVFRPGDVCSDTSDVFRVSNYPAPVPVVSSDDTLICASDSTRIDCSGAFSSYLWNNGDTLPYTFVNYAGATWVTVTDANGCSGVSNRQNTSIYAVTPISIIVQGDTLSSFNGASYQWYRNDTLILGAVAAVYVAQETGFYSLEIVDNNGCYVRSSQVNVIVSGLEDFTEKSFSLYPNPADDEIVISNYSPSLGEIEVKDILGRLVLTGFLSGSSVLRLDISNFLSGIYWFTLSSDAGVGTRKFIKK